MNENKKVEINVECTFLPVGSVVMLKGATKPLIIIGFAVVGKESDKVWDYMGAMYPMGVISSDNSLMFNRDQIDKVISEGYSDDNEKYFRLELERNLLALKG